MIPELLAIRNSDERSIALQSLTTDQLEGYAVKCAAMIHDRTETPENGIDTHELLDLAQLLRNIDDILEQS